MAGSVLDDWRLKRKEIGMLYCGRSGAAVISAMCTVWAARNGSLAGNGVGASLSWRMARFSYGPIQVWPHWPSGPAVEVLALPA